MQFFECLRNFELNLKSQYTVFFFFLLRAYDSFILFYSAKASMKVRLSYRGLVDQQILRAHRDYKLVRVNIALTLAFCLI